MLRDFDILVINDKQYRKTNKLSWNIASYIILNHRKQTFRLSKTNKKQVSDDIVFTIIKCNFYYRIPTVKCIDDNKNQYEFGFYEYEPEYLEIE